MLPEKNRLKSRKEIDQLFKNGRAVRNSFLFLKYKENNLKESRFAFSVGLKYSKKAVDRNEIKRILREALRPLIEKIEPGYDGAFFLSKGLIPNKKKVGLEEAKKAIEGSLEKAGLIIK